MRIITKENEIISDLFYNHIKAKGVTYAAIARNVGMSRYYVRDVVIKRYPLTKKCRQKLNNFLETNF